MKDKLELQKMLEEAAAMGAKRAIEAMLPSILNLDNQTGIGFDESKGEFDMSNRIKQRVKIAGSQEWVTGKTYQDLFDNFLSRVIEAGIVTLPSQKENVVPKKTVLFKDIANKWFTLYKVGKVRETTLAGYESYLKTHIIPYFGNRDVCDITIDSIQEFMNTKSKYAKKTIDEMLLVLGMILNIALEDGLISTNPAKSKRLQNPSTKKSVRQPLTTEQAIDVEAHLGDIPNLLDRRFVALLLFLPARCEDIRGIQMKDIDLENGLIHIRRSVTYAKSKLVIGAPKTEAGVRSMIILPKLWDILKVSDEELSDPEGYLVHMRDSRRDPLTFQSSRRMWERIEKAINVYGKTPHCFRHTFATRAYRAGVSEKTLQTMGGWADIQTMRNVYIHTQKEDLESAREILKTL